MHYLYAGLLFLVGFINLGLVHKGIDTGRIQSRMFVIRRQEGPMAFWTAIVLQCCVTMIFFVMAFYQINPD